VCVCTLCLFTLFYTKVFVVSILSFGSYLCVKVYHWRFEVLHLLIENSCTGGEKYQMNVIKLQFLKKNFNPLNLNRCQVLLPILLWVRGDGLLFGSKCEL
jgi:hypothetical protein